jgi:hypothetical protein
MEPNESRSSISNDSDCQNSGTAPSRSCRAVPLVVTLALAVASCGDSSSPRPGQAPRDTLIVNGLLPINVARWMRGASRGPITSLRVSPPSGAAHVLRSTSIACDTIGDVVVELTRLFGRHAAVVLCRPIRGFRIPLGIRIPLGSQPVELRSAGNAVGVDGKPVTLLAGTVRVLDTGIVRLVSGRIVPLRVGKAVIEFDYSGLSTFTGVEVYEVVADEPFQLVPGEVRSWGLSPGRYEVELRSENSTGGSGLRLGPYDGNCATGRDGTVRMLCLFTTAGAVVLANTNQRADASRSGTVRITRHALDATSSPAPPAPRTPPLRSPPPHPDHP